MQSLYYVREELNIHMRKDVTQVLLFDHVNIKLEGNVCVCIVRQVKINEPKTDTEYRPLSAQHNT